MPRSVETTCDFCGAEEGGRAPLIYTKMNQDAYGNKRTHIICRDCLAVFVQAGYEALGERTRLLNKAKEESREQRAS